MLYEITHVRQIPGEPRRRWFSSRTMDLFVWLGDAGSPLGFQLAYDKGRRERALTWKLEGGYVHTAIDDGESGGRHIGKATPLLVAGGEPDIEAILAEFLAAGAALPADLRDFIAARIRAYRA